VPHVAKASPVRRPVARTHKPVDPEAEVEKYGFGSSWLPLMLLLPPLVYYMWICMADHQGALYLPTSGAELLGLLQRVPAPTVASVAFVGLWFGGQILLQLYAPGRWVQGTPLDDGSRLPYKMNGWAALWITLLGAGLVCWLGWVPATFLWDELGPILTTITLLSYGLSIFLYRKGKATPEKGTTGRVMYDFFIGTQLNPRIGRFDLKLFCEARPGLLLWVLINLSVAAKQWQVHHTVSTPMILPSACSSCFTSWTTTSTKKRSSRPGT
jgi:delta14-sterol reductase